MSRITVNLKQNLRTECFNEKGEVVITDAPKTYGGNDEKFNPTDLTVASLGSCILTVMGHVAQEEGVSLEGAEIILHKTMRGEPRRIGKIIIEVRIPARFSETTMQKIEEEARHCPVHMSLHPDIEQIITFTWGAA